MKLLFAAATMAASLMDLQAAPAIFPPPREFHATSARFALDESVKILIPARAAPHDLLLARLLTAELSDRHGIALRVEAVRSVPGGGRYIVMGSAENPLVRDLLGKRRRVSNPEGYLLDAGERVIVVAGADDAGAFYGFQSLRQLISHGQVEGAEVRDWPYKSFRGIFLYLPGRENLGYFKRFVRDFMALYKYNRIILEMNASMRLDRHPEVNAGWLEFGRDMNYTRRERSWGPGRQVQDSANADSGDFGLLEKAEVAELVRYAAENHIEVIPEIPTLTHTYYLLARHRELAEIAEAEWPDTYCPSEPKVYDLVFDAIDEILEAMQPRMVHIGHDEWRTPVNVCARCRGKSETELFAADVNRIYEHLKARHVRTAMWGDHLVEAVRGVQVTHVPNPKGRPYDVPGALSAEQVSKLISKDILVFNWFWNDEKKNGGGEANEVTLRGWGFEQVYGNFRPNIGEFDRRSAQRGMLGGAPSAWAATTEVNFGKDMMFDFLGCANLLWSTARPDARALSETVQSLLPGVRRRLSAVPFPSDWDPATDVALPAGAIGQDVSSIIFTHASAKPARNRFAYTATWNYADTADLLGWYEVEYADGFVDNVPIRYGLNILELAWRQGHKAENVAYQAEAVERAGQTFFAYEWINPRFGKLVKEIRLHQATAQNPVTLARVQIVKKRAFPEVKP